MNKFFSIFKGEFYESSREMIIGEAHVCGLCGPAQCQQMKDNRCVDGHVRLINHQIKTGSVKTYRRLEKEFMGRPFECEKDRWQWYHQFLFTNFLDIAMPQGGTAPEEIFFSNACRERFLNLINTYKPRYLFILGDRTFNHLPGDESDLWSKQLIKSDNGDFNLWTLHYGGNEVQTLKLLHPAWSGMSETDFERMYNQINYLMTRTH